MWPEGGLTSFRADAQHVRISPVLNVWMTCKHYEIWWHKAQAGWPCRMNAPTCQLDNVPTPSGFRVPVTWLLLVAAVDKLVIAIAFAVWFLLVLAVLQRCRRYSISGMLLH